MLPSLSPTRGASGKLDARRCLRIINSDEICTEHLVIANFAVQRMRSATINTPRLYYCFFLIQCRLRGKTRKVGLCIFSSRHRNDVIDRTSCKKRDFIFNLLVLRWGRVAEGGTRSYWILTLKLLPETFINAFYYLLCAV